MRIALDCRSGPALQTGLGKYARLLVKSLAAVDRSNEYVCYFSPVDGPVPTGLPPHFRVRWVDGDADDPLRGRRRLASYLKEDLADLYHQVGGTYPLPRTTAWTVVTIPDVVYRRYPDLVEPGRARLLDLATARACHEADRLIAGSDFTKGEIVDLYRIDPSLVSVIPIGAARPPAGAGGAGSRAARGRAREHSDRPYLLYCGTLEARQNLGPLLQALSRLGRTPEGAAVRLVVASPVDGGASPLAGRISSLGLDGKVTILGEVSPESLEELYEGALAFIYPAVYDGFGWPPLEAMARGVPTFVSDGSSLPEVVASGAVLFDPTRPELLAGAIRKLLLEPEHRRECREKGLARASELPWTRCAERHLRLYEGLLRNHEAAPLGV